MTSSSKWACPTVIPWNPIWLTWVLCWFFFFFCQDEEGQADVESGCRTVWERALRVGKREKTTGGDVRCGHGNDSSWAGSAQTCATRAHRPCTCSRSPPSPGPGSPAAFLDGLVVNPADSGSRDSSLCIAGITTTACFGPISYHHFRLAILPFLLFGLSVLPAAPFFPSVFAGAEGKN